MNSLKVNEMVYKFQDLVTQKKVKTFTKFQNEIYLNFIIFDKNHKSFKFISYELKKMHAFLRQIQHFPNNHILAQALKPMFRMLVESIVIPKVVIVKDERFGGVTPIRYVDLILASRGKKLIQKTCDSFVIPYRGEDVVENKLLNLKMKPSWLTEFMCVKMLESMLTNPQMTNELDQIMNKIKNEVENGYLDFTNKKVIQLSEELLKFYFKMG